MKPRLVPQSNVGFLVGKTVRRQTLVSVHRPVTSGHYLNQESLTNALLTRHGILSPLTSGGTGLKRPQQKPRLRVTVL